VACSPIDTVRLSVFWSGASRLREVFEDLLPAVEEPIFNRDIGIPSCSVHNVNFTYKNFYYNLLFVLFVYPAHSSFGVYHQLHFIDLI
jgi:hypothetical protein